MDKERLQARIGELEKDRSDLADALEMALDRWYGYVSWTWGDVPGHALLGQGRGEDDSNYRAACDLLRRVREEANE